MTPSKPTRFLNVDLELLSTTNLQPLLDHLDTATLVLRNSEDNGRQTVWLELDADPADPDEAIGRFASVIESLPDNLRRQWNACDDRCLNIGIQGGYEPHASAFRLSSDTIARLAALAARLEITVYSAEKLIDSAQGG